jgi:hypothetical protein
MILLGMQEEEGSQGTAYVRIWLRLEAQQEPFVRSQRIGPWTDLSESQHQLGSEFVMTKKPTSRGAAMAKNAAVVPGIRPGTTDNPAETMTLRLPDVAHEQLRKMAFSTHRSQHSLLLEAVNLLFERHGKPPVSE